MSIREHLHFNQKIDCIEGFEDLGRHGRASNIANHALVFMLHGLHKRWKQPVAYYLTRENTKREILLDFLMAVLDACHNAGLVVVATVCDMGASNVRALKLLGVPKRHLSSGFMTKKLQRYLILIFLNVPVTFSLNMT
jgi:hypothetical protein